MLASDFACLVMRHASLFKKAIMGGQLNIILTPFGVFGGSVLGGCAGNWGEKAIKRHSKHYSSLICDEKTLIYSIFIFYEKTIIC